jgi:hypothetical protein
MGFNYIESITRKVRAAYAPVSYGGVSNEVEIIPRTGAPLRAYICPPSWFFFLQAHLFCDPSILRFYLIEEANRHWTFGVEDRTTGARIPLIDYLTSELPYWATPAYQARLAKNP